MRQEVLFPLTDHLVTLSSRVRYLCICAVVMVLTGKLAFQTHSFLPRHLGQALLPSRQSLESAPATRLHSLFLDWNKIVLTVDV